MRNNQYSTQKEKCDVGEQNVQISLGWKPVPDSRSDNYRNTQRNQYQACVELDMPLDIVNHSGTRGINRYGLQSRPRKRRMDDFVHGDELSD